MVFERTKPHIVLNPKQKSYLEKIAKSGKSEKREYDRARIILMDAEGKRVNTIARELHTNRTKVYLTIDKALSFGVVKAIKDLSGRGKKRTIMISILRQMEYKIIIHTLISIQKCTKKLNIYMGPLQLCTI